jgi:hypothetical protein
MNPIPSIPSTVEMAVERIQQSVLHYFYEGGGADANERQRREHAASILKEIFHTPLTLKMPYHDTERCEEFFRVEETVGSCLEMLHVRELPLVPELSDDGWELVIHVLE